MKNAKNKIRDSAWNMVLSKVAYKTSDRTRHEIVYGIWKPVRLKVEIQTRELIWAQLNEKLTREQLNEICKHEL